MNKRERLLFAGLLLLSAVIVSRGSLAMGGDAPHYLALSHSIAHDFDLDLRDQYTTSSGYLFWRSEATDLVSPGRKGELYASNGLAFSIAMVPVLVGAETLANAIPEPILKSVRWNRMRCARDLISVAIASLYGFLAVLTLRVTKRAGAEGAGTTLPVVLAFVTPPLLFMSFVALTEIPAALLGITFVSEQLREQPRHWRRILPLAILPWLHLRYVVIVLAGLAWIISDSRRRHAVGPVASALAVPLCSLVLLVATRWWLFGTVAPGTPPDGMLGLVAFWLAGTPGLLAGFLAVAPFWLLSLAGIPTLLHRRVDLMRFLVVAAVGTWLVAGLFEPARALVPPGRAMVPVLPMMVPLWAEGFSRLVSTGWRWSVFAAVGWGLFVSAALMARPGRMWTESGADYGRASLAAVEALSHGYSPAGRLERLGVDLDQTSFVRSVSDGNLPVVDLFLKAGFEPQTGLVAAVMGNHADVLERLLAEHAQPGLEGGRALAWATARGRTTLAAALAAAGADLKARNPAGETPLIAAVSQGRSEERRLLIRTGADVNAATATGQTALALAVERRDLEAVRDLIGAGADINSRDADGWTPILRAARRGDTVSTPTLIEAGADVNAMTRLGWTALMWAAYDGRLDIVDQLVRAGADVDRSSVAGQSALIRAAGQGHVEIVRTLIEAGADRGLTVNGVDARAWAMRNGHAAVVNLLEQTPGRP